MSDATKGTAEMVAMPHTAVDLADPGVEETKGAEGTEGENPPPQSSSKRTGFFGTNLGDTCVCALLLGFLAGIVALASAAPSNNTNGDDLDDDSSAL